MSFKTFLKNYLPIPAKYAVMQDKQYLEALARLHSQDKQILAQIKKIAKDEKKRQEELLALRKEIARLGRTEPETHFEFEDIPNVEKPVNLEVKIVNELDESLCTGCAACADICPKNCITMTRNAEGFRFPQISSECINCGKCAKTCPIITPPITHITQSAYAVMADDATRLTSSSGGVFPVAAKYVLAQQGYVAGVKWTDDFRAAEHAIISDISDLPAFHCSKYIQSETPKDFYVQIKNRLETGKFVLYSGVYCQVAALQNFLGKEYDNLITMELLCFGVPSPLVWEKYLDLELAEHESPIAAVNMRDKSTGWRRKLLLLLLLDGTTFLKGKEYLYNHAFKSKISLRKSCYHCHFKNKELKRVADITIGDFWGISRHDSKLDDNKGTSLVLLNSEKGTEFFNKLSFEVVQNVPFDIVTKNRKALTVPFAEPTTKRRIFFNAINRFDLQTAINLAESKKTEVIVLGRHTNKNLGGQLTVFATYKVIELLGYSVKMAAFSKKPKIQKQRALWEHLCLFTKADVGNLKNLNKEGDSFVTTPDWTFHKTWSLGWNVFTQPFTTDEKRRIAFGASFGNGGGYEESDYPELKRRLERFIALGIREPSGLEICEKAGITNAIIMHDAVFALDRDFYTRLSLIDRDNERFWNGVDGKKYMFVYLRSPDAEKMRIITETAASLQLEIVMKDRPKITDTHVKWFGELSMCEFLAAMNKSEFIFTDSFHATCFSLILNKNFLTLKRFETAKFSKLSTLLKRADLMERLITADHTEIQNIPPIDWDAVNEKLDIWRAEALNFIDTALKQEMVK
ncbi:MAG: Coenzyme F420 hydrogenase/dehydrogenase, beta subunit C-terminal domain [Turicibacter sp.]|nr:Coenzyme F420 hydrogenase/dehydrogenase, beta subunit C-terminal domain [Turicibacter sp.]